MLIDPGAADAPSAEPPGARAGVIGERRLRSLSLARWHVVCFSVQADVVAGIVVGVIGLDGARHVRRPEERALAALPLLLAGHQLIEAFVWWSLGHRVPHPLEPLAVSLYLVIAFGVLPVLVPIAVAVLEPRGTGRRLAPFAAVGVFVAAALTWAVLRGPAAARIEGHHIAYDLDLWQGGLTVALYVLATCGPMLFSSWPHVRRFGVLNLAAAATLAWLSQNSFISLWCLWAGVTSIAIALQLRLGPWPPRRARLAH